MDREQYRQVMSSWASGVTVVAARSDERVVATTVSAFLSLSLDPPSVLVALGPNATVRPFLIVGACCGISILAAGQRRVASVFADSFPVGPDPFTPDECPVIADALVRLRCRVTEVTTGGSHVLVIASVEDAAARSGDPLIRHAGRYTGLGTAD